MLTTTECENQSKYIGLDTNLLKKHLSQVWFVEWSLSCLKCDFLYSFKQLLKNSIPSAPKYFSYGVKKFNILLCQLRNCKSQSKIDLHSDHLEESPICTNCNLGVLETVEHFFLECPQFATERLELINSRAP